MHACFEFFFLLIINKIHQNMQHANMHSLFFYPRERGRVIIIPLLNYSWIFLNISLMYWLSVRYVQLFNYSNIRSLFSTPAGALLYIYAYLVSLFHGSRPAPSDQPSVGRPAVYHHLVGLMHQFLASEGVGQHGEEGIPVGMVGATLAVARTTARRAQGDGHTHHAGDHEGRPYRGGTTTRRARARNNHQTREGLLTGRYTKAESRRYLVNEGLFWLIIS